MRLKHLLKGIYDGNIPEKFQDLDINSICVDSRQAIPNSLFVALKGTLKDGNQFIADAITHGARAVIKSHEASINSLTNDAYLFSVANPRKALLDLSNRFYDHPSKKIKVIGITGTNGKTTITYLIESILKSANKKTAVIGTVNYRIGNKTLPSKNTTPGLLENQQLLFQMVQERVEYCIMEVSSHALDQSRVEAIDFQAAIFTNLTGDHMDYHGTMENYFDAKAKLFTSLKSHAAAVINVDDDYGKKLCPMTKGKLLTYALDHAADYTVEDLMMSLTGSKFHVVSPDGSIDIQTPLIGRHNVSNIVAAAGACCSLGIDLKVIKKGIESLATVPGRLERVDCGQSFHVFVDYAHTDDALKSVLEALRQFGKQNIIAVFGCGGDRDKTKRPKMGKVAGELSDHTILTSDNPRSENPEAIVKEIAAGFNRQNFTIELDRQKAIEKALKLAKSGDIILIAGKGHEDYQIFKDKTIHFDDRDMARRLLNV